MSSIPSEIAASALQAGYQSREAAAKRDKDGNDAITGNQSTSRTGSITDVVETSDEDMQAFADADGLGSQGRDDTSESPSDPESQAEDSNDTGPSADGHLDITA